VLPTAKESAALVAAEDAYLKKMSAFDRASRAGKTEAPSLSEFAAHVGSQTLDFTSEETAKATTAVNTIRPLLTALKLELPAKIFLVKTTGKEDADAAYCRGPIIVMPTRYLGQPQEAVTSVLTHELFHVFSSHHPELRNKLYGLLGFRPCSEPKLPASLDDRRFTNPDCMAMNYYTVLRHEDRDMAVMPTLVSKTAKFDPASGKRLFSLIDFVLIELTVADGKTSVVMKDGEPVVHQAMSIPAYPRAMSQNTSYIWHPEEVLADNFVHAIFPGRRLNAPELPGKLVKIMQSGAKATAPR
jgi:hypothetical protein